MKGFGFWVLLFTVGAALVFLGSSSKGRISFISADVLAYHQNDVLKTAASRKPKEENKHNPGKGNRDSGDVNLEDYRPIDPVPSSKASIRPGPIQHGTPLMPYIPKPSPPAHPKFAGGGYP